MEHTCKQCREIFNGDPGRKFCSRSCAVTFNNAKNPKRKREQLTCEYCGIKFLRNHKGQRFCSVTCGNRHNAKYAKDRDWSGWSQFIGESVRTGFTIKSIHEVSSRTKAKILNRLNLGCARCGWNEAACDIHHIIPRKDNGTDDHDNLIMVCPNCHRLLDRGLIRAEEVPSLTEYFPSDWQDKYYG